VIDHFTLSVRDIGKSRAFYEKALAPLGYRVKMQWEKYVGFGDDRKPYFWIKESATPSTPMHIAFIARTRPLVDAFHAAALDGGAKDDGAPGIRADYHANYYAAFVVDPEGHPIEAVCHAPPEAKKAATAKKPKRSAPTKRRR
jgi:catechol 2,3-dioxygenase-like lactoylglutathione lyase family enzyme